MSVGFPGVRNVIVVLVFVPVTVAPVPDVHPIRPCKFLLEKLMVRIVPNIWMRRPLRYLYVVRLVVLHDVREEFINDLRSAPRRGWVTPPRNFIRIGYGLAQGLKYLCSASA